MFRPNQICTLYKRAGRNIHAEEIFGAGIQIGYSPVTLLRQSEKTSVRADSSASRGQADQITVKAKILVDKAVSLGIDDKIEIEGDAYAVKGVHRRKNVFGVLDHLEVDLEPKP